jgi:hypothetical protein
VETVVRISLPKFQIIEIKQENYVSYAVTLMQESLETENSTENREAVDDFVISLEETSKSK